MTWARPPARSKQIGGEAPARGPTRARMATAADVVHIRIPAPAPVVRDPEVARGNRIRESARNEECDIRIPGACNFNRETTVWSHFPGLAGGRGMGFKSLDFCGTYACSACHDVVDDRASAPADMTRQDVMLCWHEGHLRSLVKLHSKGLL